MRDKMRFYAGLVAGLLILLIAGIWGWKLPDRENAAEDANKVTIVQQEKSIPSPEKELYSKAKTLEQVQAPIPAEDVLVYTFEGTRTYVTAGSVTYDAEKQIWRAKTHNVYGKPEIKSVPSPVGFRQRGQEILSEGNGNWTPIDEMERSIFLKVSQIAKSAR